MLRRKSRTNADYNEVAMIKRIKKTYLVIGVAALTAALALRTVTGEIRNNGHKNPVSVTVAAVRQGDAETDVMAEGVIVPAVIANVSVLPAFEGQVKKVTVNNGSHVVKGQVLAEIDPAEGQDSLGEARAEEEQHRAQYQLALTPHRPEEIAHAQADVARWQAHYDLVRNPHRPEEIQQARLKVEGDRQTIAETQARLQALQNGSRAQQVAESAAALESQQTKQRSAETAAQRSKVLYEKELIPRAEWEQAQADLAVANNAVTAAREQLSLLKEGARPEEIQAAQATLERAKSACAVDQEQVKILQQGARPEELREAAAFLRQAQLTCRILLEGSRPEHIRSAAALLQKAHLAAHRQATLFDHHLVRAPISGVVIARNISPGEVASPDTAHTSATDPLTVNSRSLFVIADDSTVEFQANADQRYYGSLRVGQAATVQIEALPGRSFQGTIVRINPLINPDKVGRTDSYNVTNPTSPLTFSLWVRVPNPQRLLVPGQVGLIRLSRRQPGLMLPQSALTAYSLGEGTVYVCRDGVIHRRSVKYDGNTGGSLHVLSGLGEGDQVVVSDPTGLADGMEVKTIAAPTDGNGGN